MEKCRKLYGLLREALWGIPFDEKISPNEARQLIAVADKQTVAGLVIDMLIKKNIHMEQQTVFHAYGYLEQIKQKNMLMNKEVTTFARLMKDTGTDYLIVKGQTLAALYPNPLTRTPGDIDFLVKDYHYAANILKEYWAIELPNRLAEKECAFSHATVLYELHTYLIDFGSNRHKRYWEKMLAISKLETITINDAEVRVMEPTLYSAYIFLHLFFHFVLEGIGLRHLCDWAVIMHHYADKIDKEKMSVVLQNVGFLKAFRAFGTVLVDMLGMKDFPLPLSEKDRRLQSRIVKDILQGGNFGRDNRYVKKVGLKYKAETMMISVKNSFCYATLAPKEMMLLLYRRFIVNLKLVVARIICKS